MALSLARALLPLLAVTMVTRAAPLAGQTTGEEVAVAANGDSNSVDIAKRAKEEIVFGNQQNSARLGAAKKSVEPSPDQPQPVLPQETPLQQQASAGEQDKANEPEQPSPAAAAAAAADVPEKAEQASSEAKEESQEEQAADSGDAGEPQGSDEEQAVPEEQPSSEGVQEAQSPSSDQSDSTETENSNTNEAQEAPQAQPLKSAEGEAEGEAEKEEEEEAAQPVPVEGGEHPEAEEEEEEEEQQQLDSNPDLPLLSGLEEGGMHAAPEDVAAENAAEVSPGDDDPMAADTGNGQDSDNAAQEDEVESLLTDLQNTNNVQAEGSGNGDAESKAAEEEEEEVEEEQEGDDDEGSAERELMQMTSQLAGNAGSSSLMSGSGGGDGSSSSSSGRGGEYSQSLLNYILSHGDEYGHRLPYPPADPYYLQRRRRSLAARSYFGLPHIHRRRRRRGPRNNNNDNDVGGQKELSRAKRTKRDLFDDGLYYNAADSRGYYNNDNPLLEREEEEEEESEEEKDAEIQELLTYLTALYPALYGDGGDLPPGNTPAQIPGYLWQGPTYPTEGDDSEDEEEGEGPYWLEPSSGYQEPPRVGWGEPELQPAPAWEPSFYPEEVGDEEEEEEEVPEFYPALSKRQMMSFVPGERRKRYFFPFAREPYTHWGAFVPSQKKRGGYYEEEQEEQDPYRRLRELAMVLAEEDRQPSPPAYFDALDEYKKK